MGYGPERPQAKELSGEPNIRANSGTRKKWPNFVISPEASGGVARSEDRKADSESVRRGRLGNKLPPDWTHISGSIITNEGHSRVERPKAIWIVLT